MYEKLLWGIMICLLCGCTKTPDLPTSKSCEDLQFDALAKTWDEGIPLGNGWIGALVWQRDSALRLSLDRTDLWDLRPMDSLSGPNHRFSWVREQIRKNDYLPVQQKYDHPYDRLPAPSKIPGAALEFSLSRIGDPNRVRLYLNNALCEVDWENGTRFRTFVHATQPVGWFIFENLDETIEPILKTPEYGKRENTGDAGPVSGQDLSRLGYEQGDVVRDGNRISYRQQGWGDFSYEVDVRWKRSGKTLTGTWSITSSMTADQAAKKTQTALRRGIERDYEAHTEFWNEYWARSSVSLPDSLLQRQYRNEMYKFGSATREDSYPISLQAVWTADNGKLPPWKGDYHHDLNTQLSYWPAYIGNHLNEGLGYLNTLWNQRDIYKRYTKQYFETDGLNVPGVCTLTGEPMGGWIQYSMSPTVGAWLAQHFYLHWKYSADRRFLQKRAYPFIRESALFTERISYLDAQGVRRLEFSSSPEIFDNSIRAWFPETTNYDLALMHFIFQAAGELATELQLSDDAEHWKTLKEQLPPFDTDEDGGLTFAPGHPYTQSHRHFSNALAIHPLGIIDWSQGEASQRIIRATLKNLEKYGPDWWCGYSYSWQGNLLARAFDGEGAARALQTFARCFCLPNTFHANGDQTRSGKSRFTYRPFTLEGNFAFAAAIQEMLMQSHTGTIRIFPAVPASWKEIAFRDLRAMGAFLVSAERKNGRTTHIRIYPEQGGTLRLSLPADNWSIEGNRKEIKNEGDILIIETEKGVPVELNVPDENRRTTDDCNTEND